MRATEGRLVGAALRFSCSEMSSEQGVFTSIENHLRESSDKMAKKKAKGRFSPKRGGSKNKSEPKIGTPGKAKASDEETRQNFYEEDLHKNALVWSKGAQGRGVATAFEVGRERLAVVVAEP